MAHTNEGFCTIHANTIGEALWSVFTPTGRDSIHDSRHGAKRRARELTRDELLHSLQHILNLRDNEIDPSYEVDFSDPRNEHLRIESIDATLNEGFLAGIIPKDMHKRLYRQLYRNRKNRVVFYAMVEEEIDNARRIDLDEVDDEDMEEFSNE